jgi:hypothetical protein
MDGAMFLAVLARWIHTLAAALLLGGVIYARFAFLPALRGLSPQERRGVMDAAAARFAPWIYGALAAAVLSGLYNFLTKPFYPPRYHMWFGIKFLVALHVIAVMVLLARARPDEDKRARWTVGVLVSGVIVFLISAFLRWLTLSTPQT